MPSDIPDRQVSCLLGMIITEQVEVNLDNRVLGNHVQSHCQRLGSSLSGFRKNILANQTRQF